MSEREWGFYLKDMIIFSEKVLAYTEVQFGNSTRG